MDVKRKDDFRASALRSAFAGALAACGLDRSVADRCLIERSAFSGFTITHDAAYAPDGTDFFVIDDASTLASDLAGRMEETVDRIREYTDRKHAIHAACRRARKTFVDAFGQVGIEPSGMRLISYDDVPQPTVHVSIAYEGLDDMLEHTTHVLGHSDPMGAYDPMEMLRLLVAPRQEKQRRALLGDRTPEQGRRISGHLARAIRRLGEAEAHEMIGRIDTVVSQGEEPSHTTASGIHHLRFVDGVLEAAIEEGHTVLDRDVLTIPGATLPEALILQLPKRRVSEVVDHALLRDRRISAATQDEDGVQLTIVPPATEQLIRFMERIEEAA